MSSAAERNRRSRQRQKQGLRWRGFDFPDSATEDLIDALVYFGALNEAEAEDDDRVDEELAKLGQALLQWFAGHWRELDHASGFEIPMIRVSRRPPDSER